jgi:hypothetical protein
VLDIEWTLDISKFIYNSCIMDAGILTHKSPYYCATRSSYPWLVVARYIQRCGFSTRPPPPSFSWLYPIQRGIMSYSNSSSGWPSDPNHPGGESDFSSDLQPNYEGYTGYNDNAATEYAGQSSYSGNSISMPSVGSHIYTPNVSQYNSSNMVTPGTDVSGYQDQNL